VGRTSRCARGFDASEVVSGHAAPGVRLDGPVRGQNLRGLFVGRLPRHSMEGITE
jgi:hypothetical protein